MATNPFDRTAVQNNQAAPVQNNQAAPAPANQGQAPSTPQFNNGETTAIPQFNNGATGGGEKITDYAGSPLLIRPLRFEAGIQTDYGVTDAMRRSGYCWTGATAAPSTPAWCSPVFWSRPSTATWSPPTRSPWALSDRVPLSRVSPRRGCSTRWRTRHTRMSRSRLARPRAGSNLHH